MKKGNVVDLLHYRTEREANLLAQPVMSDELKAEIQNLIYRMRELGPLQPSS